MKKRFLILLGFFVLFLWLPKPSFALGTTEELIQIQITPIPCSPGRGCPTDLIGVYGERGEACVGNLTEFQANPITNHYWIEDPEVTDQGRANERARQFIYWTINRPAIDNSPTLRYIWTITRDIAMFFIILATALLGVGMIVGQRMNFDLKVRIWPALLKVVGMLVYVFFSAAIVLALIQISEILMKFFIERLGGSDLFNIYFSGRNNLNAPAGAPGTATGWSEQNYLDFYGCRDLNIRVQEGAQAEMFLFKATNITYYVMGSMIILRKIILWFLLFVSPFLALLFPFSYIRNIGWIWVGVFFQWLFYGPLFALFLGSLALIWKIGIPWQFDFSRVNQTIGYIFPTAIIITYGGPGQQLTALNNGNYIDTFAEYVITLLMLWAVIVFPWWLLRIFRDYCCDYLMSIKNILLSWYDKSRVVPPTPGHPPTGPAKYFPTGITNTELKMPESTQAPVKIQLETLEQIRKSDTSSIITAMDMSSKSITDIAKFETNKTSNQNVAKNIQLLQNPMKAESAAERQQYMNIRTELLNRSLKQDTLAKQVLSSISNSQTERVQQKESFVKSITQTAQATQPVTVNAQQAASQEVVRTAITSASQNETVRTTMTETLTNTMQTDTVRSHSMVESMVKSATTNEAVRTKLVEAVSQSTVMSVEDKQSISTKISQNSFTSETEKKQAIESIVNASKTDTVMSSKIAETVTSVMATDKTVQNTVVNAVSQTSNAAQLVSLSTQVPAAKVQSITTSAVSLLHKDNPVIAAVYKETGVAPIIITKVLTIWSQNTDKQPEEIVKKITTETSLNKEQASSVIQSTQKNITASKEVASQVAKMENMQESTVQKVLDTQANLMSTPKTKEVGVEHKITLPPEVSIEDYEEVKKMWTKQYEKGEIPLSDTTKTRKDWVENDVVFITNVINKLLSTDEKVRMQGLDEIGYILPIFMINNFKGNELLVYLKAKLVAAKQIQEDLEKEDAIKEKLKAKEEDLVVLDAARGKKEEEKTMQLEQAQSMEIPEDTKPETGTN